jgi:hypothetical protein
MVLSQWQWLAVCIGSSILLQANGVSSISLIPDDQPRCKGLEFDLSRIRSIASNGAGETTFFSDETTSYSVKEVTPVPMPDNGLESSSCIGQQIRIQEKKNGVPIYGSTLVATVDDCELTEATTTWKTRENVAEEKIKMLIEKGGINDVQFRHITGKSFAGINVKGGYTPSYTPEAAASFLAKLYNISVDEIEEKIEAPELYIFPSEVADYMAYFTTVLVTDEDGNPKVLRVVVDAHDFRVLRTCVLSMTPDIRERKRRLRYGDSQRNLQTRQNLCRTCAVQQSLSSISSTETTQQVRRSIAAELC